MISFARIKLLLPVILHGCFVGVMGAALYHFIPELAVGLLFFMLAIISTALKAQQLWNIGQAEFNLHASDLFKAQADVNKSVSETSTRIVSTQQDLMSLIKSEHNDDLNKPSSKLN